MALARRQRRRVGSADRNAGRADVAMARRRG
jgi:hypothetical protein